VTAVRAMPVLTGPVEDYLKVIFELEASAGSAGTNEIAAVLRFAPPSVSGMVRRLAGQGLITYERYRGVRLTRSGRRAALRTIRRHRVIEAYLTSALGYSWDAVHDEAERIEHAASDELIDRMAAAIGDPRTDPHGAPIPTREGAVDETRHATLADLAAGTDARVVQVSDDDPALLRYLAELRIRPGAVIRVVARAPFGGPVSLVVDGVECAVGPALAAAVAVLG
jgi:DtxR family Mn-dependent transcriptional regulator